MSKARRIDGIPNVADQSISSTADDDYYLFLSSLFGEDVLPDDDKDDPDFVEDLNRVMADFSDEDFLNFPQERYDLPLEDDPMMSPTWQLGSVEPPPPENHGYSFLSPARCTRSRYPLDELTIEDLEGQLYQRLDNNIDDRDFFVADEMFDTNMERWPASLEDGMAPQIPEISYQHDVQEKDQIPDLPANFNSPSPEFTDLFPYGLMTTDTAHPLFPSSSNEQDAESVRVLQVHTINGPILMASNAWTPHSILALNRIINSHIQLLIQSHSSCVGIPYLRKTCDEMNGMLHSLHHLFQLQSTGDYPFDRMLITHVAPLLSRQYQHNGATTRIEGTQSNPRKRTRQQVECLEPPSEVIDLTDDTEDVFLAPESLSRSCPFMTVLDVPLMHLVPHLWQALTIVTMKTNGTFVTQYDRQRIEAVSQSKRQKGIVSCISAPRRIQKALRTLREFMTCGTKLMSDGPTKYGKIWSKSEVLLLAYALRRHGADYSFIHQVYLPSKDQNLLERGVEKIKSLRVDLEWKRIEKILLETNGSCTMMSGLDKKVISAQDKLFAFCTDIQHERRRASTPEVEIIPHHNLTSMRRVQNQILNSTSQLMEHAKAIVEVPNHGPMRPVQVQDGVCLMLEQLGRQISASVDTILAMFNLIGALHPTRERRNSTQSFRNNSRH